MSGAPAVSKERARMEVPGKRADSTSAAGGHYRPPTGSGGFGREWQNTIRMTEHELLRIIAFLERVRQPFQELIPIADEDATWKIGRASCRERVLMPV